MDTTEIALLNKLRDAFRAEAPQKVRRVRRLLHDSMKEPSPEQYSEILRELHNLKGISRISALDAIQTLCESIYRLAKNCQYPPQKEVYELSMEGLQLVEDMIPLDDGDDSKSSELCRRISDLLALQDSES